MTEATSRSHGSAWDPLCPARLFILPGNNNSDSNAGLDYVYSHTGACSCNKHEKAALIKIIQAHEYYHDRLDKVVDATQPSREFSRSCRAALQSGLLAWQQEMEQQQQQEAEMTAAEIQAQERNKENFELLKMTYSAMHLSDVILPLLPTHAALNTDYRHDPFRMDGAASANFVRYLRCQHMDSVDLMEEDIPEMLQSTQPDQYGDGSLYWRYVEALVIRGLLQDAWTILERHSQYQAAVAFARSKAQNNDPGIVETLDLIREGFHIIREVLLRSPLPGGRNDANDDALGIMQQDDDEMNTDFYLQGLDVGPSDYQYWEIDTTGDDSSDYPVVFSPEAAIRRHNKWQNFVKHEVRHKLPLSRRIPEIENILAILCGDFSTVSFEAWPEKLCAHLLYLRPDCKPRDLSALVLRTMKEFDAHKQPFSDTIVKITGGNAGIAVATFYTLGAASGAALSTTLLSVLYNMFLESSIVSPEGAVHKTEFLTEAALAIVSSLASNESDVGIDLSTRLLLPYTLQEDCSPEVVACLTEILEHYSPTSEQSANNILNRCEKLITKMKNRRVLESCASIILCCYRSHRSQSRPGAGVAWLLRGVQMEAILTENAVDGSCYRTLAALCYATAGGILNALSKSEQVDGEVTLTAREMAAEIEREGLSSKGDMKIREMPPVVVFMQSHAMFEAARDGNRFLLPKCIVTCLTKGAESHGGSATTFTPLPLQAPILEIACKLILDDFEQAQQSGSTSTTSVFDKHGVSLLMESLVLLETQSDFELDYLKIKEVLLRGLSQAIIAENATKRICRAARDGWKPLGHTNIAAIPSASLSAHPHSVQEAVVQRMLDF